MRVLGVVAIVLFMADAAQAQSLTVLDSQMSAIVPASSIQTSLSWSFYDWFEYDDEFATLDGHGGALGDGGGIGVDVTGGAGFVSVTSSEIGLETSGVMSWSINPDVIDGEFDYAFNLEARATIGVESATPSGTVDLKLQFGGGSVSRDFGIATYLDFEFDEEYLYVNLDGDSWDDWDGTAEFNWTPDVIVGFPTLSDTVYLTVDDGTEIDVMTACGQYGYVGPISCVTGGPVPATLSCSAGTTLFVNIVP